MTTDDRTRAIAWFEKQSKCLAMPGAAKMFGLAAEALNEGRWISVKNRLPKKSGFYFAFQQSKIAGPLMTVRYFYKQDSTGFVCDGEVTYWRPLPEPPKGE